MPSSLGDRMEQPNLEETGIGATKCSMSVDCDGRVRQQEKKRQSSCGRDAGLRQLQPCRVLPLLDKCVKLRLSTKSCVQVRRIFPAGRGTQNRASCDTCQVPGHANLWAGGMSVHTGGGCRLEKNTMQLRRGGKQSAGFRNEGAG